MRPPPLPSSYWVSERFLAGAYPGARDELQARENLRRIADAGVTLFVNLTEESEPLEPYAALLDKGVRVVRIPVRDFDCPSHDDMRRILDTVDAELERGGVPYLHCWGGIGRTGTAVGCWLVEHGLEPDEAIAQIAEWRRATPGAERRSPETEEQREFIRAWRGAT